MPRMKYSADHAPSPSPSSAYYGIQALLLKDYSKHSHSNQRALIVGFAALGAGVLILTVFLVYLWYNRHKSNRTSPYELIGIKVQRFSYAELKAATRSFNAAHKLGKGGFGVVYRGVLRNGKEVAVKKLDVSSLQGEKEFQNELSVIGGLRSPFIVSLLGYCADGKRRLLVYEHMQNRSLQEALFDNDDLPSKLDWEKRFNIILDIAQALSFLHLECDPPIIHGDVKPSNVLLDGNFCARIADFGLARVKCDDLYYADTFSQELFGRSQELWKSQDLLKSQDLGRINGEGSLGKVSSRKMESFNVPIDIDGPSSCNNIDEEEGAQAVRDSKHADDEMHPTEEETIADHPAHAGPGKYFVEAEDWNKIGPSEEGTDWSKELQALPSDPKDQKKKPWGKDWWWRHDGGGEPSTKEYVMEWIGSHVRPSRGLDDPKRNKKRKRKRIPKEPSSGEIIARTEPTRKPEDEKGRRKPRKIREWWKEEYLAEMTKKSRKLERKWEKSPNLEVQKFDCRRNLRTDSRGRDSLFCRDRDHNGDMSFGREWKSRDKIKRDMSIGSETWSGDLLSRDLSSTTSTRGTVCYIPPEYGGCSGFLSEKGDIYSFGVLVLVIISGRRPLHVLASPMKDFEKGNLISWARHLAQTGNLLDLVCDSLKGNFDKDQASLCITLSLLCLQRIPETRPDISDIVKILKGETDAPSLPLEYSPSPPCKFFNKHNRKPISDPSASPADFPQLRQL